MPTIDLNCDMGEGFGAYQTTTDKEILPYITSANIACGFHAGDPATMQRTVELALENDVAIGAHPGFQDLVGFGRRNMAVTPKEAYQLVVYQIGALDGFVRAVGGKMQHVKPHGALYNMAAKDSSLAEAIAEAVYHVNPELIFFGLANSALVEAGKRIGLRTASEVFSDRTYQADGLLTSRMVENALITDQRQAIRQVMQMVLNQRVLSTTEKLIPINADTICIHGDNSTAIALAKAIHRALKEANVEIKKAGRFIS